MKKSKNFWGTKFSSNILKSVFDCLEQLSNDKKISISRMFVEEEEEEWTYDDLNEFLSAYRGEISHAAGISINIKEPKIEFILRLNKYYTTVSVEASSRSWIEKIFHYFEDARPEEIEKLNQQDSMDNGPTVFIGNGRNKQWQKLRDHLRDKHSIYVECFESGERAGHTVRDILDRLSEDASLAFLILTGEDKTQDNQIRARQNVIHEVGLFQGRLGFDRGIILVESGVEMPSNFDGIQQIRFRKGRIEETFGDVIGTISREFGRLSSI